MVFCFGNHYYSIQGPVLGVLRGLYGAGNQNWTSGAKHVRQPIELLLQPSPGVFNLDRKEEGVLINILLRHHSLQYY